MGASILYPSRQNSLGYPLNKPRKLFSPAFGPWFLVPGPYPLWLNICASRAIDRQSIGNSKGMILSPHGKI